MTLGEYLTEVGVIQPVTTRERVMAAEVKEKIEYMIEDGRNTLSLTLDRDDGLIGLHDCDETIFVTPAQSRQQVEAGGQEGEG